MATAGPGVLIVDDNRANLLALEATLRRGPYRLFIATSGREALEIAAREAPMVALLDVNMPIMDGPEVARRLLARTPQPAVVFVTADDGLDEELQAAGGVDYLVKPVEPSVVRTKVARLVEEVRQRRESERR